MIRISAGEKKGKKLHSLKGEITRPTSERLKLSLFNILQFEIQDKIILDLFAGTGQLSLEAISRGAKFAFMCDNSKEAAEIINKNINECGYQTKTKLLNCDYKTAIKKAGNYVEKNKKYNLVFLDPPYSKGIIQDALYEINENKLLCDEAIIIAEMDSNDEIINEINNFTVYNVKKYGRTKFVFYK